MRVERDKAVTGPLSVRVSQLCISVTKMPMNYLIPETTLPVVSRVESDGAELPITAAKKPRTPMTALTGFHSVQTPARDERLPLGVGLPSLLNPLWKCLHRDSLTDTPEENLASLLADSKPIQGDNQRHPTDHPEGWISKHEFMFEFESLCSVYITEHGNP